MPLPTVFTHVRQALLTKSNQRGRRLVRHDDLPLIRIDAAEPVNFQVDGDLVGQRTRVEFHSVPGALSVIV
jgi:diacylglycerol kinase family enzyme